VPRLEHIGIAIDEIESVIECFDDLLGIHPYKAETVSEQEVRTHFLDAGPRKDPGSAKLEFLESLDDDSAVQRFLDRRGEGLHHLAFEIDNAEATMERLRTAGFTLLSDTPQTGADDKRIFFVHPKETHGVLVEFCETTPADWTPHQIHHDDRKLAAYERGTESAPPLVLLHGAAGSTRRDCAPLMRRLESSYRLIGIDLSGHGASSLPADGTLTMNHFVDDVMAVLDSYELSSAHLFGFSLGSAVALRCACTAPSRVKRLALLAPNDHWDASLVSAMNDRLRLEHRTSEQQEQFRNQHEHTDLLLPALRDFISTLPGHNDAIEDTLSDVSTSTLVVGLDEDPLFPVDATLQVYEALSDARLAILPGSHHSLAEAPVPLLAPLLHNHFS
jgi:methylmalonyl-CoA epimerase